jgi:hypothetical protein
LHKTSSNKRKNDDNRLMNCEAYDLAEQQYIDVDRIWGEEATVYTFEDGSRLKFSENRVVAL